MELAIRGVLAFGVALVATSAMTASFATIQVKFDPERAHAMSPGNGTISAAYATQLFAEQSTAGADSAARQVALLALRQDATAVDALGVLGLQAQLEGNLDRAAAIFAYSHRLSRRELQPQVAAIEMAVNAGDIAGALRHYDVALRTSRDAQGVLFPVLGTAIAEPRVRSAIIPVLASKSNWSTDFLGYIATSGTNSKAAAQLFEEGEKLGLVVTEELWARLVSSLFAENNTDEAWRLYAEKRPGARRDVVRNADFRLEIRNVTPFDWNTDIDGSSYALIAAGQDVGTLEFSLPPGQGGVLARQAQMLPVGQYAITGRTAGIEGPERLRQYWQVACIDGRELARIPLPNSSVNGGRFAGRFSVPPSCGTQILSLVARPSDGLGDQSGQIELVEVTSLGAREDS